MNFSLFDYKSDLLKRKNMFSTLSFKYIFIFYLIIKNNKNK